MSKTRYVVLGSVAAASLGSVLAARALWKWTVRRVTSPSSRASPTSSSTTSTHATTLRFTVLNKRSEPTREAARAAMVAAYKTTQVELDEVSSALITQAHQDTVDRDTARTKSLAKQHGIELQHLLDDFDDLVRIDFTRAPPLVPTKKKRTSSPSSSSEPDALVEVTVRASSGADRAKSRRYSSGTIFKTLARPVVFLFDFVDQEPLLPALQLLTTFVDHVMRQGVPGKDRVVLRVESPGGRVDQYGLAAAQVERLRRGGFYLEVCVDQVAASGGYLMAAVAHRIVAAPFATVGSIGVVMQYFNLHKLLQRVDVYEKTLTAGTDKRLMSQFSDYGGDADKRLQQQLDAIHAQFRDFVRRFRPHMDMDAVATGGTWLAEQAYDLGMVDVLMASDEYLTLLMRDYAVVHVTLQAPPKADTSLWSLVFGDSTHDKKEERSTTTLRELVKVVTQTLSETWTEHYYAHQAQASRHMLRFQ